MKYSHYQIDLIRFRRHENDKYTWKEKAAIHPFISKDSSKESRYLLDATVKFKSLNSNFASHKCSILLFKFVAETNDIPPRGYLYAFSYFKPEMYGEQLLTFLGTKLSAFTVQLTLL